MDMVLVLTVIFNPVETFKMIQMRRSKFNYFVPFLLMVSVVLARIFYINTVHFPFSVIDPRETSILIEASKVLIPLITWTVSFFGITSILGGESYYREILFAGTLCMVPYTVISVIMALASNLMGGNDSSLFFSINSIMWIWVFTLFFFSSKIMNNYSTIKTVRIVALSVLSMLLIWAVAVLIYTLTNQFLLFIVDVVREVRLRV